MKDLSAHFPPLNRPQLLVANPIRVAFSARAAPQVFLAPALLVFLASTLLYPAVAFGVNQNDFEMAMETIVELPEQGIVTAHEEDFAEPISKSFSEEDLLDTANTLLKEKAITQIRSMILLYL